MEEEGVVDPDLLPDFVEEDEEANGSAKPRKDVEKIKAEKEARRRAKVLKARKAHKAKLKEKHVKRDYTWKNVPLESIEFFAPAVCLDLTFMEILPEKEAVSVANQVQQCYGYNRKHSRPLQLHLLGCHLPSVERCFSRHEGYNNWKLFRHNCVHLHEAFPGRRIVYLSPDSPNMVDGSLVESSSSSSSAPSDFNVVYVIGGIADNQNQMRGASMARAIAENVDHGRLPIAESVAGVTTRGTVCNVNHVFAMLVERAAGFSWAQAVDKALPTRASFREPTKTSSSSTTVNNNNNEEDV